MDKLHFCPFSDWRGDINLHYVGLKSPTSSVTKVRGVGGHCSLAISQLLLPVRKSRSNLEIRVAFITMECKESNISLPETSHGHGSSMDGILHLSLM